VVEARVWLSLWIATPSLASIAWCRPSDQAPAGHGAARVLVDQYHLAALHDVLDIALEHGVGAQRRMHVVQQGQVGRCVEAVALLEQAFPDQQLLDELVAGLAQLHLAHLLVDGEVALLVALLTLFGLALQLWHQLVDALVELGAVLRRTGDDQRRARLVDEDRVDLVDDGKAEGSLQLLLEAEGHVVAQVVEAELVVGAVDDIGGVGVALFLLTLAGADDTDPQPEELVQGSHPLCIATGKIVVHGYHVHRSARERIQVGGQRRHQRLALAGAHLGDLALVQGHATDQLHVEVAHAKGATPRLAGHGKRLGQQAVEGLAVGQARAELVGLRRQGDVIECLQRFLERVDTPHHLAHALEFAFVAGTKDFFQHTRGHVDCVGVVGVRRPQAPWTAWEIGRRGVAGDPLPAPSARRRERGTGRRGASDRKAPKAARKCLTAGGEFPRPKRPRQVSRRQWPVPGSRRSAPFSGRQR
jgi:hypothetical protein